MPTHFCLVCETQILKAYWFCLNRRRTPYAQEAHGNVKLVEEVGEEEESDEQEGGEDVKEIGLEVDDDRGLSGISICHFAASWATTKN